MNTLTRCPGIYCGRELLSDGNWSECGACPRGFRVNTTTSACVPCNDAPRFYDWLYLGFMALLVLVLHWFCIDKVFVPDRDISKKMIALHLSALLEIVLASLIALQLTDPIGTFTINSCSSKSMSDWYTLLYNPNPNYEATLHCTQEAVYPLYTIVFIFYALGIILMLLIRPLIAKKFLSKGKLSIYAALYFYPILALLHAVGGGVIYYMFPYITIILSVLSNAAHFTYRLNQKMESLLLQSISDIKNVIVILGHWLLHAYGVIAVATLCKVNIHPAMLALVPLPALFYIITVRFTDPHKLNIE